MLSYVIGNCVLASVTILLHVIGLYLLKCLFQDGKGDVQHIYIANLSAAELLGLICGLVKSCLNIVTLTVGGLYENVKKHINIFLLTSISFMLYLNMFFIIVDRTVEVIWSIKYPLYWNTQYAKYLELLTWMCGLVMYVTVCTAVVKFDFEYRIIFASYFRPILDVLFLITTVSCYCYLFKKYRISRAAPASVTGTFDTPANDNSIEHPHDDETHHPPSLLDDFRKSRFFISICLTTTFLGFIVIPDIIQINITRNKEENKIQPMNLLTAVIYYCSAASDVFIYVFGNTQVKMLLYKKLRKITCLRKVVPKTKHEIVTSHDNNIV